MQQLSSRDIRTFITSINDSGRPAIANDALGYCKQLSTFGIKLALTSNNPAVAFSFSDAGGVEKSRDRAFFTTAKNNNKSFSRDNYLACVLLLCLGVRKSELCEAK